MNNLNENISILKREIKNIILSSNYKNNQMFVLTYKPYLIDQTNIFFIAQPLFVGKINNQNLTINPVYEDGMLICNILIKRIYKIGVFYFKYNDKNVIDFIDNFDFNLEHHTYNYILGEYGKIKSKSHKFNFKSRMRMKDLNNSENIIEKYLILCQEKNWDCNYRGVKS